MAAPLSFPAPLRGWVENDNPVSARGGAASVLENFLPTPTGTRLRGGCQSVSNVGGPIIGMFGYDNGVTQRLFAATANAIKDASVMDMSAASVVVPGFLGGEPVATQFATLGKTYLYVVNGIDYPWLYDGSTWQQVRSGTTPVAITGTGADQFSHVWAFKSRLFFAVANSMKIWSLPVGQVGGAAVDLSLAGVFQKGGRVLFGTTWSADSGAGMGDRCVIVTDRGEVAIFEGTDPADPSRWGLVGRYEIAPPLGPNAHLKVGGDVLIATTQGLVPLSGVVTKDPLALESIAISRPISRTWSNTVAATGLGWRVVKWDNAGVVMVLPATGRADAWAAYAQTGAWCRITGWDMTAAAMHKGRLYFGGRDGYVKQADTTGRDDGVPFTGRFRGLPEQTPRLGFKTVTLARAWFNATSDVRCGLRFVTRADDDFPPPPRPWTPMEPAGGWDSGMWDQMLWDQGNDEMRLVGTMWRSVGASGAMIAPEVQVVSDSQLPSLCELISVDAVVEAGGVVV